MLLFSFVLSFDNRFKKKKFLLFCFNVEICSVLYGHCQVFHYFFLYSSDFGVIKSLLKWL